MISKKTACLILAGVIALGVCSCDGYFAIKPDGPREVEEETSSEEVTTTTTTESTTEETSETSSETTAEASTESTTEATARNTAKDTTPEPLTDDEEATIFVSFQDKTAEEITENFIKISTITQNTTLDNYPDCFTVYPNDTIYKDGEVNNCYYFWDPVALNSPEGLRQVMVCIKRSSGGTLSAGSRVDIVITVEDNDRQDLIYNAACEALKTVCGCTELSKSGTAGNETSSYLTYYVTKQTTDDGSLSLVMSFPLKEAVPEAPAAE